MLLKQDLRQTMEKFTKSQRYVLAVQLYECSTKILNTNKCLTQIKHVEGYVSERTNLNALLQHNYEYDADLYLEFSNSLHQLSIGEINPLLRFIQKHNHYLSQKAKLEPSDSIVYAFVRLGIELLEELFGLQVFFMDPDRKNQLQRMERTGIFRALLLDQSMMYTFEYQGDGEKKGRLYLTKKTELNGKPHVFLITLNSKILSEEDPQHQLATVANAFIELITEDLKGHLKVLYNDGTNRILGIGGNKDGN